MLSREVIPTPTERSKSVEASDEAKSLFDERKKSERRTRALTLVERTISGI
jgi:hypothetical protein